MYLKELINSYRRKIAINYIQFQREKILKILIKYFRDIKNTTDQETIDNINKLINILEKEYNQLGVVVKILLKNL